MRLLLTCPGVRYRTGRILSVNGGTEVEFEDGAVETFDRVVTRYGASNDFLFNPQDPLVVAEDPLLIQPFYLAPSSNTYVYPVREGLAQARDALFARPVASRAKQVNSSYYVHRVRYGPDGFAPDDFWGRDPEPGLVKELQQGRRLTYLTQAEIHRVIKGR